MSSRGLARGLIPTLILCLTPVAFSEDSLEEAKRLLDSKRYEDAVDAYEAWLDGNLESDEYPGAVLEIAPYLEDLDSRVQRMATALTRPMPPVIRHTLLVLIADAEVHAGMLLDAQRHYVEASFAVPGERDPASLLQAAYLAFELGASDEAAALSRIVLETSGVEHLERDARVLLSRAYYAEGKYESAVDTMVSDGELRDDLGSAGLYWLTRLSFLLELPHISIASKARLEREHPESLEQSLVSGEIDRIVTASYLFEAVRENSSSSEDAESREPPRDAVASSEADSTEAGSAGAESRGTVVEGGDKPRADAAVETEPTTIRAIQTGSFTVRENAVYAASDLRSEGFVAAIEEKVVNEVLYYRVLVPLESGDLPNRKIIELKEAGFEGYPIYE